MSESRLRIVRITINTAKTGRANSDAAIQSATSSLPTVNRAIVPTPCMENSAPPSTVATSVTITAIQ